MSHGHWTDVARAVGLLAPDGAVSSTIFAEMSALATRTGAVNLGQGFPDVDGPAHLKAAAIAAIERGDNQYPPGPGIPALLDAVATHQRRCYGLEVDPATEVLVTAGATEALAATILALAGPGDEVVTLEPFYDSYTAAIALSGATHRTIPLRPTPEGFRLDASDVEAAFSPRTRLVLVNSPHNPTGTVLTADELGLIARAAIAHDAVVVTDEVYEHLVYDGARHVPMATLPGMAERTVTISSAGKTFSFTGWKVGWLHGPAELVTAVRTVKQFLTYVASGPFQHAVAVGLADEEGRTGEYVTGLARSLQQRRDLLCGALTEAGFAPVVPRGTYFVVADGAGLGYEDAVDLCRDLPERAGVVAIPVTAFCTPGGEVARQLRSYVRFTYVKQEATLEQAARGLARLGG
ncbi:pyridoxal phosphate-dependent aminotransferase [Georgenia yuyongxinii]|uniref:Pyridoxal phosphate-dependent aminotransferase n=1 Tax=Georgenia yuyongxinii TaxID=2589797 RepID=A0A5B8C861_9MICO|nr:pyridoxal phosphate-dependent aminotransferase [Georgenia yuyongxinii]QDC26287.1 pyridoxal phosphate-dependent aminotransferase [Georgenia yuyongxinii]